MAKQTGIVPQSMVLAIWHDWYKKAEGTEANAEELRKVLNGDEPLPAGARIRLGVDSIPRDIADKDADLVAQFPDWRFTLKDKATGAVVAEDVIPTRPGLDNESYHGKFMSLQSPNRPDGFNVGSRGYAPIFTFEPHVPGPLVLTHKAEFENGWSAWDEFPRVNGAAA